jgi:hypothetical protein
MKGDFGCHIEAGCGKIFWQLELPAFLRFMRFMRFMRFKCGVCGEMNETQLRQKNLPHP